MENEQSAEEQVGEKPRSRAEGELSRRVVSDTVVIALPNQPWYPEQKWITKEVSYENVY